MRLLLMSMMLGLSQDQLEVCMKDWAELADEYRDLELRHKEYREVSSLWILLCPCTVCG